MLFAVPALWPHDAPRGQILHGAEFGAVNGLLALGLVLTYRASRVINFSYGAMGALAATVAVELNLAHHVNWFVCICIALVVGAALGLFVDFIIRWRFFTAPRPDRHGGDHRLGPAVRGDPAPRAGLVERTLHRRRRHHAAQLAPPADLPRPLQRQRPARSPSSCPWSWSRWAGSCCAPTPASPCARWPTTRTGPASSASRSPALDAGLGHRRRARRADDHAERTVPRHHHRGGRWSGAHPPRAGRRHHRQHGEPAAGLRRRCGARHHERAVRIQLAPLRQRRSGTW